MQLDGFWLTSPCACMRAYLERLEPAHTVRCRWGVWCPATGPTVALPHAAHNGQ